MFHFFNPGTVGDQENGDIPKDLSALDFEDPDGGNLPDSIEAFYGVNTTDLEIGYNFTYNSSSLELTNKPIENSTNAILKVPTGSFNQTRTNFTFPKVTYDEVFDVETDFMMDFTFELPIIDDPWWIMTTSEKTYAMSFNISDSADKLSDLQLCLHLMQPIDEGNIKVWIFNSTDVLGNYTPFMPIALMDCKPAPGPGFSWVNFTGSVPLDVTNTVNNTFFVIPFVDGSLGDLNVYWGYAFDDFFPDFLDEGHASYRVTFPIWQPGPVDFALQNLVVEHSPWPSEIDLRISGSAVQDLLVDGDRGGSWVNNSLFTPESDGSVHFNFSCNMSKSVEIEDLILNGTALNSTWAPTKVIAQGLQSLADWNVTIQDVSYPDVAISAVGVGGDAAESMVMKETFVNLTVPANWTVQNCTYNNGTEVPNWSNTTLGQDIFVFFLAENASYLVSCTSPNFLTLVQVFNSSDLVKVAYDEFYLNDTLEINATLSISSTDLALLQIYSESQGNQSIDRSNLSISGTSVQFTKRLADYSPYNGTYWMKVSFFNGTHVGMNYTNISCRLIHTNLTLLDYDPIPPIVERGERVSALVHYNTSQQVLNLTGANITTDWLGIYGGYNWSEMGDGQYNITFRTVSAPTGIHDINITAYKWGYENATLQFTFNITGGYNTTLNFIDYYRFDGQKNWTDPDPFFDDLKPIRIEYTNSSNGAPLHGAVISNQPSWRAEPLLFSDLYFKLGEPYDGQYDIYVDTTDLLSEQIVYVDFAIFLADYQVKQARFWINITRVNATYLELITTGYNFLECYQGESVELATSYFDQYHSTPILFSSPAIGNVTWKIAGVVDTPQLMPLSILEYQDIIDIQEHAIPPGYYNVTIEAEAARNYVDFSKNVTLHVLDNLNTTIMYEINPVVEIREGESINLVANLTSQNGTLFEPVEGVIIEFENLDTQDTHSAITNENGTAVWFNIILPNQTTLRIEMNYSGTPQIDPATNTTNYTILPKYEPSITVVVEEAGLPFILAGEDIHVQITLKNKDTLAPIPNVPVFIIIEFEGISYAVINETVYTNQDGIAEQSITIPPDAGDATSILIWVEYRGEGTIAAGQSSGLNIAIENIPRLIIKNLWWILLIIGSILGTILVIQYGYRRPKKQRRIEMKTKIAQKIMDVENIQHLMLIHADTGAAIYSQSFGAEVNPDLISGFLTAISAFQSEIGIKKKRSGEEGKKGFELSYADFIILLNDSQKGTCRSAFILKESPSEGFRQRARDFLQAFEDKFHSTLITWDGGLRTFTETDKILNQFFEMKYLGSYKVKDLRKKEERALDALERVATHVARRLERTKGSFPISELLEQLETAREEPRYELLYAIDRLIALGVFTHAQVVPETPREGAPAPVDAQPTSEAPFMPSPMREPPRPSAPSGTLEDVIPKLGIHELTHEEREFLGSELASMDNASQKILVRALLSYPPEVRKRSLSHIISTRTKKIMETMALMEAAQQLIKENRDQDALRSLQECKRIYEDLGKEEITNEITLHIRELVLKLNDTNIVAQMRQRALETKLEAEIYTAQQKYLEASTEYSKAARLFSQIGDDKRAQEARSQAKSMENLEAFE